MSKSSRCTRIIALASGHRREDRHLVLIGERVVAPDIFLVDRDPHDREVAQRLRVPRTARAEPVEQPGEIEDLHPNTSEKGRKSQISPGSSAAVASPTTTRPSERTIEDRMHAPSRGYLTATSAAPSRSSRARRYSRRPGFLR